MDVVIRATPLGDLGHQSWTHVGRRFKATRGCALYESEDGARFLVEDGRTISVDVPPGVDDDALAQGLLQPVMAMLLHQRHLLALHASAVQAPSGAVAFLGQLGLRHLTGPAGEIELNHRSRHSRSRLDDNETIGRERFEKRGRLDSTRLVVDFELPGQGRDDGLDTRRLFDECPDPAAHSIEGEVLARGDAQHHREAVHIGVNEIRMA
jgi:hypothetical protein